MAGPETQEASWRRRMPELVLRTDRYDNEGSKGGLPDRGVIILGAHCASPQALPPRRAPEPPHLPPTALAPLLWGLQVPISGDAPFPASQTKQDGLTAPHLGAGPCLSPWDPVLFSSRSLLPPGSSTTVLWPLFLRRLFLNAQKPVEVLKLLPLAFSFPCTPMTLS